MADKYSLCLLDICNHIGDSEKQTWGIYTIINELQRASLELSDCFVTPWTVACQAPLSMRFPGQEYWSRLPFPSPGDLFHSGIQPASPASPTLAGGFFTTEPLGKPVSLEYIRLMHQYTNLGQVSMKTLRDIF